MNFTDNCCHLSCNDVLILSWGWLSNWLLLKVKICLLPSTILWNTAWNGTILLKIKQWSIDFHNVFRKSRFSQESIRNESLSGFEEFSIPNILFPNRKYFSHCIRFEKSNVGNDIKQCRFMHPIRQSNYLGWHRILFSLCFKLFLHLLRVNFNNTMGWYGIILIQDHFFLVFICSDDFKVIRSESVRIDLLYTIDEFNWSCVAIFCKKWNCRFTSFNSF